MKILIVMVAIVLSSIALPKEEKEVQITDSKPVVSQVKKELEPIKDTPKEVIPEPVATAVIETPPPPVAALDNETITWNFLVAQGFTRNQTAGIMGNLMQEHRFQTSGDGLAQWTAGRKANMLARPDPYSINSQLNFLMSELNGGYSGVKANILASDSLENSVLVFQNQFERCGDCRQQQRIMYAYDILGRH